MSVTQRSWVIGSWRDQGKDCVCIYLHWGWVKLWASWMSLSLTPGIIYNPNYLTWPSHLLLGLCIHHIPLIPLTQTWDTPHPTTGIPFVNTSLATLINFMSVSSMNLGLLENPYSKIQITFFQRQAWHLIQTFLCSAEWAEAYGHISFSKKGENVEKASGWGIAWFRST